MPGRGTWYAQAERLAPGRTIAVYDLGGGTFDATVLRRRADGRFESLGHPEGIARLGGIDVDEAVFDRVLRAVGIERADLDGRAGRADGHDRDDDPGLRTAVAQLRRACVEAKETLSSETSVTIPVWLPGLHHEVLLQRAELEELIGPLLQPTTDALARVVASAGLRPDDLDAVLLVGGSSRIPLIGRQVSAGIGRPIAVDAHPKHPVALGAALDADAHRSTLSAGGPGPAGVAPRPVPASPVTAGPALPALEGPAAPAAPSAPPVAAPLGHGGPGGPPIPGPPFRELPPLHLPRPDPMADTSSRRILLLASLATPIALVVLIFFTVIRGENPPTTGIDTDGTGGTGATSASSGDTGADSTSLLADPSPALQAFAGMSETAPQVRELVLHPDLATADVQVPGEPTHVDEYTWRADGGISGPEPVTQGIADLEGDPFDLSEINPAVIPLATQTMLQTCPGEGLELTHVIIRHDLNLDPQGRTLMLIYASNERDDGGYIAYALDGTPVSSHC